MRRFGYNANGEFIIMMILAFLFVSCEKAFRWEYTEVSEEIPVVEAIITNENVNHSIVLSLVRTDPNSPVVPLSGAQVSVSMAGNTYIFTEQAGNEGRYVSETPFIGTITDIRLKVIYNDKTYEATDKMIPVSPSNNGLFLPVGLDSSMYYFVESSSVLYTPETAMWEFNVQWDFLPQYSGADPDSCRARFFYYDLKVIDQGQIFAPQQEKLYFPKGSKVFQTKYSLSEEHKKFRRSLLLETEWEGGLMDVSPGTVHTNVTNGGMGFFGACSVARDTFYIQ